MLPNIKYMPVNWVDGMKISKQHLQHMENVICDHIRDAAGIRMTNYNYGLLPTGIAARQSLDIQVHHDSSGVVKVKVIECRAVTPGGVRIEITQQSKPIESSLSVSEAKSQAYELILVADPFTRVAFGQPDPEESPIRQPYTTPHYRLDIVPYPRTTHAEFSAFQLCIGRLRTDGEVIKLSEQYIPPCAQVSSSSRLMAIYNHLLGVLGTLEIHASEISQKFMAKSNATNYDIGILRLAQQTAFFLASNLDTLRLINGQQPPVFTLEFFVRWARLIHMTLNGMIRKDKEDLLNYIHSWYAITPREFENMLRGLLTLEYNHNEAHEALNKVEAFADKMAQLFQKMSELHHSPHVYDKPKLYGWLVVHTESKPKQVFALKEKRVYVGRDDNGAGSICIMDDHKISRKHARLDVVEAGNDMEYIITDHNSVNGTFIHDTGTRLKAEAAFNLAAGDTIQIGGTNLVIVSPGMATNEQEAVTRVSNMKMFGAIDMIPQFV